MYRSAASGLVQFGDFDFGYQWITKVVRYSNSGRIVGTGIRLKNFILDESGRQIEKEFD
jgi:hypothetical protein